MQFSNNDASWLHVNSGFKSGVWTDGYIPWQLRVAACYKLWHVMRQSGLSQRFTRYNSWLNCERYVKLVPVISNTERVLISLSVRPNMSSSTVNRVLQNGVHASICITCDTFTDQCVALRCLNPWLSFCVHVILTSLPGGPMLFC